MAYGNPINRWEYEDMSFVGTRQPVNEEAIARALVSAITHAKSVGIRENLKPSRFDRVNQFMVSLRRFLIQECTENTVWVNRFCKKDLWYDIGVMSPNAADTLLRKCLMKAKSYEDSVRVQTYEIERGLEMASSELLGVKVSIDEADRINAESEEVIAQIQQLFS